MQHVFRQYEDNTTNCLINGLLVSTNEEITNNRELVLDLPDEVYKLLIKLVLLNPVIYLGSTFVTLTVKNVEIKFNHDSVVLHNECGYSFITKLFYDHTTQNRPPILCDYLYYLILENNL